MSPADRRPGFARAAAEVNEEIRALMAQAGGPLSSEQRRQYERLLEEWAAAVRENAVIAA